MSDPLHNHSDEDLVKAIVARDKIAFATLYDRYVQPVYAIGAHLAGLDAAEEITQEIFLQLWMRANQFDPSRGTFRSWFLTIARNRAVDELKRRSSEERKQIASTINTMLTSALDPTEEALHSVWINEHQNSMLQALAKLPSEQRQVIVMAYYGGYTQSSIARILDLPLGTVKKRIQLGMQKLRIALIHSYEVK